MALALEPSSDTICNAPPGILLDKSPITKKGAEYNIFFSIAQKILTILCSYLNGFTFRVVTLVELTMLELGPKFGCIEPTTFVVIVREGEPTSCGGGKNYYWIWKNRQTHHTFHLLKKSELLLHISPKRHTFLHHAP